jgi:hypothetical protein
MAARRHAGRARAEVHDNLRSLGLERLGLVNLRLIGEGDGMPDPDVPLPELDAEDRSTLEA